MVEHLPSMGEDLGSIPSATHVSQNKVGSVLTLPEKTLLSLELGNQALPQSPDSPADSPHCLAASEQAGGWYLTPCLPEQGQPGSQSQGFLTEWRPTRGWPAVLSLL